MKHKMVPFLSLFLSVSPIFSLAVHYRIFALTPGMKALDRNVDTDAYVVTEIVVFIHHKYSIDKQVILYN